MPLSYYAVVILTKRKVGHPVLISLRTRYPPHAPTTPGGRTHFYHETIFKPNTIRYNIDIVYPTSGITICYGRLHNLLFRFILRSCNYQYAQSCQPPPFDLASQKMWRLRLVHIGRSLSELPRWKLSVGLLTLSHLRS